MLNEMGTKQWGALIAGFIVAIVAGRMYMLWSGQSAQNLPHNDEVHVHSDIIVYLSGMQVDLSAEEHQSFAGHVLHDDIHLHDEQGGVIHRHEAGVTLFEFVQSLGYTLTETCITDDAGSEYCTNEDEQLLLFVNGVTVSPIESYVSEEEDRILLYYGDPTAEIVSELLGAISDESCIYSGTCPERGIAPPENCGLTCEL